jgi:hypothetical protein
MRRYVFQRKKDFYKIDYTELYKELVDKLGHPGDNPQRWYVHGGDEVCYINILDDTLAVVGLEALVKAHGKESAAVARAKVRKDTAKHELVIDKELRKIAIQSAKAKGAIPVDYPE